MFTLRIDPAHGTSFDFNVKMPWPGHTDRRGAFAFRLRFFAEHAHVGYETLFQGADSIETA